MQIGFFVSKNAEALFNAIGQEELSNGNQEAQVRAIVDYINKHGGVAGKKIVPVFGTYDPTEGPATPQREAACAKWLEDNKVAVITAESYPEFQGCSNKHKVPLLHANTYPITMEEFRRTPLMATTTTPSDERLHPAWVDSLAASGYFKPKKVDVALPMKLGVLYLDTPEQGRSYKNNLLPALTRRGQKVTVAIGLPPKPQDTISAMGSAVLRFRSEGVTNLMLMDTGGLALFFMPQAESQNYRPRYGLHSFSKPATIDTSSQIPPEQLTEAVAAGWWSTLDTRFRPPDNAAARRCMAIMKAAGQDMTQLLAREGALAYCDMAFTLQAVAAKAPTLAPDEFMRGLNTLGTEYLVATAFQSSFVGRRDGPAELRPSAFLDECECFKYTSSVGIRF